MVEMTLWESVQFYIFHYMTVSLVFLIVIIPAIICFSVIYIQRKSLSNEIIAFILGVIIAPTCLMLSGGDSVHRYAKLSSNDKVLKNLIIAMEAEKIKKDKKEETYQNHKKEINNKINKLAEQNGLEVKVE